MLLPPVELLISCRIFSIAANQPFYTILGYTMLCTDQVIHHFVLMCKDFVLMCKGSVASWMEIQRQFLVYETLLNQNYS